MAGHLQTNVLQLNFSHMRRTLLRYLLVEETIPFFVSLFVLTLVLFLGKTIRYTKLLFITGSGLADFAKLLACLVPYLLAFTIPMATLLAILLAFARLAHDNELTAMKAAGISLYQTIPPVALLAGFACLVTLALSNFVLPHANSAFQRTVLEMARSRGQLILKERVFNDQFAGLVFFINSISPDGKHLREVFISDNRSPETKRSIIAEEGFVISSTDGNRMILRLLRGTIFRVGAEMQSLQTIRFRNYDFNFDLASLALTDKEFHKSERHLTFTELSKAMAAARSGSKEYGRLSYEFHRRLSLPFACIVLGFLAAPLSVQSRTGSRFSGVVLGILLFLLYYVFISGAKALGEKGSCPPAVGLWLPNVIFSILAIFLWIKTARESRFKPVVAVQRLVGAITTRVKSR
ncbi:MAG: LPS export ABC transporter permease LptF [Deltaproteobacteria bacterium]|jgi:lipopolysaccharide export system permease protein